MPIDVFLRSQLSALVVVFLAKMDQTDLPTVAIPSEEFDVSSAKKQMKAVVAIDDSDASLHALKWTVDHLFDASGAGESREVSGDGEKTLVILHVQKPLRHLVYQTDALLTTPSSDVVQAVTKALEENSARIIARAMEVCRGMSATVEAMVVDGKPKKTICDVAEKIHPDLVVVGGRGLGKIKRAFLGSVSDYCAHHLHCPVLIVKQEKGLMSD